MLVSGVGRGGGDIVDEGSVGAEAVLDGGADFTGRRAGPRHHRKGPSFLPLSS